MGLRHKKCWGNVWLVNPQAVASPPGSKPEGNVRVSAVREGPEGVLDPWVAKPLGFAPGLVFRCGQTRDDGLLAVARRGGGRATRS